MSIKTCVVIGYTYGGGMTESIAVFETGLFGIDCKYATAKDFIDHVVKTKGEDLRITNVVIG